MKDAQLLGLGHTIRQFREREGLSQEDLAFRAGLHRTYVGQLESGDRNPSFLVLIRLARALQIPVSKLFPDD